MEYVQPIREKEKIDQFKNELIKKGMRDYMLFNIGINTGLRISDILKLTVSDVKENTHIVIREEKTNKQKRIKINGVLDEIDKYIQGMKDEDSAPSVTMRYIGINQDMLDSAMDDFRI